MSVFKEAKYRYRKIIVSTNIAESSITIDGIVYIIDSMYQKIRYFDYLKGYDTLNIIPISKSQAN